MKILIVDDSITTRKTLEIICRSIEDVTEIEFAQDGKVATKKIISFAPDIIFLDVNMPEMDGIAVLHWMKMKNLNIPVLLLTIVSEDNVAEATKLIEVGAYEYLAKPKNENEYTELLKPRIIQTIEAIKLKNEVKGLIGEDNIDNTSKPLPLMQEIKIISIGISTGGPDALLEVIPQITKAIKIPVVIVQHMPPIFTKALADSLSLKSQIPVVEAKNEEELQPGMVYIAPGGVHLELIKIKAGNKKVAVRTFDAAPINNCKPSIDVLFKSVSSIYGRQSVGIIMTGMGTDGVEGLRFMKEQGALTISQDEASSAVFGMPKCAIEAGVVDRIFSLQEIGEYLSKFS